jgi:hypothetical protein
LRPNQKSPTGILAVTFGLIAVVVWNSITFDHSPVQFDGMFRASNDIKSELIRDRYSVDVIPPQSVCDRAAKPGSGPEICVGQTERRQYRKGEAISASVTWRNAPAGSSVIVFLERDDASPAIRYLGPVGTLILYPIPASDDGGIHFKWNGRKMPCAPADAPGLCDETAEVGRYRLRALLYDRKQIQIAGLGPASQAKLLAHHASPPFVVAGKPDLRAIASLLWMGAENTAEGPMPMHDLKSEIKVYERFGGRICAVFPGRPPLGGSIESCVLKSALIGDAGLLVFNPDQAWITRSVFVR